MSGATRTGLVAVASLATAAATAPVARAQEPTEGHEFVDPPPEVIVAEEAGARRQLEQRGDVKDAPGYVPGYQRGAAVGLSPHVPQRQPGMPAAFTPSFGAPTPSQDLRFDFHGYLQVALRAGIGQRTDAGEEQAGTTLHADPVVPGGAFGWFDHTNTVPIPWAQLNFVYGNDTVRATAIIGAWSATEVDEASGSFMDNAQMLFTDAFLTYTPDVSPVGLEVNVGVFPDRYGAMAKYHQGAYGASLIAWIQGAGITTSLDLPFEGNWNLLLEGGFKGELDAPPLGIPEEGWNEYARAEEGATFAGHGHVGVKLAERVTPTLHYVRSFSADDRDDLRDLPYTPENEAQVRKDGTLSIQAADVRVEGGRFGYFYAGASRVVGEHANSLTDLVRILNAGSGKELNERYWGFASQGNGTLTLVGTQYSLSLGTLLRHPMEFWGEGPDLGVTLFGIYGHSNGEVDAVGDRQMLKYGGELVYSFSRYLSAAGRVDHVMPDLDDGGRSFVVITPKLVARTDWVTRESVTLMYSGYLLGDDVRVQGDNRLVNVASGDPDRHVLALYGTFWW